MRPRGSTAAAEVVPHLRQGLRGGPGAVGLAIRVVDLIRRDPQRVNPARRISQDDLAPSCIGRSGKNSLRWRPASVGPTGAGVDPAVAAGLLPDQVDHIVQPHCDPGQHVAAARVQRNWGLPGTRRQALAVVDLAGGAARSAGAAVDDVDAALGVYGDVRIFARTDHPERGPGTTRRSAAVIDALLAGPDRMQRIVRCDGESGHNV